MDQPIEANEVALVLSGGGAKGAFEVGVLAALEEAGIVPTILAGTSAGALNAAAVAAGLSADELTALWGGLQSRDVMRPRHDLHRLLRPLHLLRDPRELVGLGRAHTTTEHLLDSIGWTWLFRIDPLRERLVTLLGGERLPIADGRTLTVACIEVGTGHLVRFTNRMPDAHRDRRLYREVELTVDHVLASAAIPGLFEPVAIGDELYWDGGLVANTPLGAALAYEPDVAVVVGAGAVDRDVGEPESLGQVVSLMVDHLLRFALLQDLDHAQTVNELCRAAPAATAHRPVELVPVFPDRSRPGIGELLDFEPERAAILIDDGRDAGRRALEAWQRGETPDIDVVRARGGA